MFSLAHKTALITGASGGIGSAIAQAFHAQGATVILSGTREEALQSVAKTLKDRVHTIPCNLSNSEAAAALVEQAEKAAGSVDILICNAGITKDNLALRMKEEDFEQVLAVNLKAAFILNREAIKRMIRKKWGRIINMTSVVAVSGNPGQANYAASKAGLIGMSKSLAAEVASRGVTINCIAPGFIETAMTDILPDAQKEKLFAGIPVGTFGKPEDIAHGAVFLASDEAAYITGQTLHINGGMLMV